MATKRDINRQTLKLFWHHVRRYPQYVAGIAIGVPAAVLVEQYLPPIIVAHLLNRLAKGDFVPGQVWASFGGSLVLYGILLVAGSIGWRIVDRFNWSLEGNVTRDIAQRVYGHLLDQSAAFHANTFGGSLVSQTNKLLGAYVRFADTTMYQVIQLFVGILFAAVILAPRAPQFVGVLLALAAIFMVSGIFVTRPVRRLSAVQAKRESKQTGYLADSVTNIMAIKSFAGGTFERSAFAGLTGRTQQSLMQLMHANQRQMAFFSLFSRVISAVALVMAVVGVVVFKANVATAFLIFSYTGNLVGQLWQFCNNSLRNYNRALGDAYEMTKILDITPEILDPAEPETVHISHGQVSFEAVTFQHDGAEKPLFDRLDLRIKPGEKVGLVGHSGSGKTTLTRLLLRFSDIQGGAVRIDGQDIAAITQDDLRRHIAYVPQEPLLFHRTIAENIAYGAADAERATIEGVAKMASAHEFITALPKGYDTLVGERGVKLSGGQRQRIAIARAMLKNAPILALDEATSALDSESEVLIQAALWKLMEGRTAIVIAHRLSTVQKMDRIIVLDDGKIVEEGSHKELIGKTNGTYAKLWAHQSGGFIEE
ncbi:MAG TPA: ABC transporter ATP-binding protein [Candidatus Saccharimonadales bacterium]|nr:ABC transporter ATP-binding protein [Candidatus Saccharimonadales bacterium]